MKILNLKKEIYDREYIEYAIKAYKDLAEIKMRDGKEYIELSFSHCKYEEERTVSEFENYLIGAVNM